MEINPCVGCAIEQAPQHFDLHTGEYKPHSFSRSGLYKPASVGPLQEHTDYFSSLPQIDEPEIFGMHENANITFNRAESSTLMSSILALQPREGGGGGGKSSDEIVIDVIDDAEERMPALLDEDDKGPTQCINQIVATRLATAQS